MRLNPFRSRVACRSVLSTNNIDADKLHNMIDKYIIAQLWMIHASAWM